MDHAIAWLLAVIVGYAFLGGVTQALLRQISANTAWAIWWPLSLPFAIGAIIFNFVAAQYAAEKQVTTIGQPAKIKVPVADNTEVLSRVETLEKSILRVEALLLQHQRNGKRQRVKVAEKPGEQKAVEIPEEHEINTE